MLVRNLKVEVDPTEIGAIDIRLSAKDTAILITEEEVAALWDELDYLPIFERPKLLHLYNELNVILRTLEKEKKS